MYDGGPPHFVETGHRFPADLDADVTALDMGATIKPDPAAAQYLARYIAFDGKLAAILLVANLCRHDKGFLQWAPAWHFIQRIQPWPMRTCL